MIPSTWFRRLVLSLFLLEVVGGIMWASAKLSTDLAHSDQLQTIGSLMFLFSFYAGTPLMARFLAPRPCRSAERQRRLAGIVASLGSSCPVFLYDHQDQEANTVGLIPAHAHIYLTTGMFDQLSDTGLRAVIAHENTHARELHILVALGYACTFAAGSYVTGSKAFFVAGFLLFLCLRRYLEYRADAGGARRVGGAAMLTGLREMELLYPSKRWTRWLVAIMSYPTLSMRMKAVETGKLELL